MGTKQQGTYAPDGAKYATPTNGAGSLHPTTTSNKGQTKTQGSVAPDGSVYFVLTNGNGSTV